MNIEHSVDVDDLIKRVAELEALVEKLKACGNCTHYEPHCITNEKKCAIDNQYRNRTHKCDKWEAK